MPWALASVYSLHRPGCLVGSGGIAHQQSSFGYLIRNACSCLIKKVYLLVTKVLASSYLLAEIFLKSVQGRMARNTGWGKSMFIAVYMQNNTITNK